MGVITPPPLPFCVQLLDRKSLPYRIYRRRYLGELAFYVLIVAIVQAVGFIGFVLLRWADGKDSVVGVVAGILFGGILMMGALLILALLLIQRQRELNFNRDVSGDIRCEVYLTDDGIRLKYPGSCFDLSATSFSQVEYAKGAINLRFAPFSFILKNDESASAIVAHLNQIKALKSGVRS